jgi:hypothetical protein
LSCDIASGVVFWHQMQMTTLQNYTSRRGRPLVHERYWQMVDACRAIVASDFPDEAKKAACLSVLRDYVERIALSRYGCRDLQLRFYGDMLVLRDQLKPVIVEDELGQLAIVPMSRWVNEWIRSHGIHRGIV